MQPIKKFLEANFRIKVLIPMITVMVVMLALTVWFVDYRTKQQVKSDAREALTTYDTEFRQLQVNHLKYMRLRFQTLAGVPKYSSVFITMDFKSIKDQLSRMLAEEGLSGQNLKFALFTPDEAAPNAEPMIQPSDISSALVSQVRQSVKAGGESGQMNDVTVVDGRLYNLVSVPIYNTEHNQCGTLTFGEEMNHETAQEYSDFTKKPAVLIANGRVAAATFSDSADESQFESVFRQLAAAGADGVAQVTIGQEHFFCAAGNFSSSIDDRASGYLLFSRCDPPASTVQTQRLLLAAIIIGILVGSALVLFFVNKATQPLRDLHDAAEAVGRGDFSHRVNVRTRDEFGELAHAFNQMTENIELSQSKLKQTVETLKTTQGQLIQSEKLSAVGEFVAGVAHELNNPLAAVMGFSEMLKDADVGDKHRRHLDMIFKSAERCTKIVQSLLSFARRQQPERKPVTVNQLIEDVLEMVAYPLRTSNVKVITHFSQKLPLVLADGHQVQQVVLNIINNARQSIEAHQGSGSITITTTGDAATVRIAIHDNGPGISPENLQRIFDPFFTTKEVGQGTGLGLSLCYGIIREHGGNIIPSSQPGEGATFTIELPAAADAAWFETIATATSGAPKSDLREGAGKKILAVDDEESLLHMMQEELVRHSYEVTTATNGETALREMREQKFDLIVCDLKMPGLNGRQVYERLRTESPEMCRRMVFVTGDVIGGPLRDFLETENRPIIAKPFSLGELRQTIKSTLAEL